MKLRQDSKDTGGAFVAFEDKDFNGSVSVKMPGKSVKAISVAALSATKFVIIDSIGNLHVLCLSSSLRGLDTGCVMRQSTQTMKVYKMAVFHDVSTGGFSKLVNCSYLLVARSIGFRRKPKGLMSCIVTFCVKCTCCRCSMTQTAWISDGCYTVHLMAVSGLDASVDESDVEDTDEKLLHRQF